MKDHPSYSGKTYKMITMLYRQTVIDLSASISASALSLPLANGGANALEFNIFYLLILLLVMG